MRFFTFRRTEAKAATQAPVAFLFLGVGPIIAGFALKARNVFLPLRGLISAAGRPNDEAKRVCANRRAAENRCNRVNCRSFAKRLNRLSRRLFASCRSVQNGEIFETFAVLESRAVVQIFQTAQSAKTPAAETDWSRALRFPASFCFVWGAVFFAFGREPKGPDSDDATQETPVAP